MLFTVYRRTAESVGELVTAANGFRYGQRLIIATGAVLMCLGVVMTAHVHYLPLLY